MILFEWLRWYRKLSTFTMYLICNFEMFSVACLQFSIISLCFVFGKIGKTVVFLHYYREWPTKSTTIQLPNGKWTFTFVFIDFISTRQTVQLYDWTLSTIQIQNVIQLRSYLLYLSVSNKILYVLFLLRKLNYAGHSHFSHFAQRTSSI